MHGPDDETEPPESSAHDGALARAFELSVPAYHELVARMAAHVNQMGLGAHVHGLDVVHDAFVIALCKPIAERPSPHDWNEFVPWMCKLAQYAALTNQKPKSRRIYDFLAPLGDLDEWIPDPGSHARDAEVPTAVRMAYDALPAEMRVIVGARAIEGKSVREIADELKLAPSTVFNRYSRGLELLHARLEEAPRRRVGRRVVALPFLLFGMVARVAHAGIASMSGRLPAFFARSPLRILGSVALGVAVGVWPSGGKPCAMPGPSTVSRAVAIGTLRRDEPRMVPPLQREGGRTADAVSKASPRSPAIAVPRPRRLDHPNPFDWMAANAARRGEVSAQGASK